MSIIKTTCTCISRLIKNWFNNYKNWPIPLFSVVQINHNMTIIRTLCVFLVLSLYTSTLASQATHDDSQHTNSSRSTNIQEMFAGSGQVKRATCRQDGERCSRDGDCCSGLCVFLIYFESDSCISRATTFDLSLPIGVNMLLIFCYIYFQWFKHYCIWSSNNCNFNVKKGPKTCLFQNNCQNC